MSVEFSQIPAKLNYPRESKGKLSSLHSDIITYVTGVYDGSQELRSRTIRLLNTVTRYILDGDTFPSKWSSAEAPFDNIIIEDEWTLKDKLGSMYINPRSVDWDIQIVDSSVEVTKKVVSDKSTDAIISTTITTPKQINNKIKTLVETDKSDLYIQPPVVPQFDVKRPWISNVIDGTVYCVYTSIPEVPTKQNEISVTTDVDMMSSEQLMNLYPHNFIRTRSPNMYEHVVDLPFHSQLGVILPIAGYTENQLIDNLIKYPHLFKLSKMKDGEIISFYNTIEIDGELHKVSEIWKNLPDTSKIPYTADFVKEYVVRRYLLERDIHHIQHKYPMYGELDPYLTLFTTPSDYIQWGYTDVVDLAKKCVESRVSYKRSRNPVIRRCESV